jgi:deoxycytidylate deaminase
VRNYDKGFVELAEALACKSHMRHKVGAVITNKKRVISVGYNRFLGLNSNIGMSDRWSIHAECDALRKALSYIHDYTNVKLTVYVARRGKGLARPCNNCMKLLMPHIDRFVYTDGGEITEEFNNEGT